MNEVYPSSHLPKLLYDLGVVPYNDPLAGSPSDYYTVMLDGRMIGWIHDAMATTLEQQIRSMKVNHLNNVSSLFLESAIRQRLSTVYSPSISPDCSSLGPYSLTFLFLELSYS